MRIVAIIFRDERLDQNSGYIYIDSWWTFASRTLSHVSMAPLSSGSLTGKQPQFICCAAAHSACFSLHQSPGGLLLVLIFPLPILKAKPGPWSWPSCDTLILELSVAQQIQHVFLHQSPGGLLLVLLFPLLILKAKGGCWSWPSCDALSLLNTHIFGCIRLLDCLFACALRTYDGPSMMEYRNETSSA